ncbi:divergent polysaccharide deacetylase family protein [Tropicimonas marinistellae]|uniref:divergent polysaccharide deacetylase family protein n=1 Tax=Tropicimonas marinistellae TaxID=1739787 RepID=UPI000836D334|nr:divergent polysaccharide deacetylase family protein [Tropicimonas marinistellae]
MGRGILSGLFWGSIISVLVLSAVSLMAPAPQPVAIAPDSADEDAISGAPTDDSAPGSADATEEEPDVAAGDAAPSSTDPVDEAPSAPNAVADAGGTEGEAQEAADATAGTAVEPPVRDAAGAEEAGTPAEPIESAADPARSGDAAGMPPARRRTEVASAVSVPAGSEFRRPPPETEAALPAPDATAPGKDSPNHPASDQATNENTVAMPDMTAAVRPETPGMAVVAPPSPQVGDPAPEVAREAGDASGPRAAANLPAPSDPAAATALDAAQTRGYPPPVTAGTVASETVGGTEIASETLASDESSAEALAPGAPEQAETPEPAVTAKAEALEASIIEALRQRRATETPETERVASTSDTGSQPVTALGAAEAERPAAVMPDVSEEEAGDLSEAVETPTVPGATETAESTMPAESAETAGVPKVAETPVVVETPDVAKTTETAEVALDSKEMPPAAEAGAQTGNAAETTVPADGDVAEVAPEVPTEVAEGVTTMPAPAESNGAADSAQSVEQSDGERLAMADATVTVPDEVAPERLPAGGDMDQAEATGDAATLPATTAETAPQSEEDLDRPERKEVTIARAGDAPPAVGDRAPTGPGVRVLPLTDRSRGNSRLPQIGTGTAQEEEDIAVAVDAPDEGLPSGTVAPGQSPRMNALSRNAAPFSNPDDRPLFSVILIDDGSRSLDRQVLATFPFPVTFAVDPTLPDAGEAAAFYRDNGFEVVVLATGLPQDAQVRDLEVTLEAELSAVPQAVAIMDPSDNGFGSRRTLVEHVVRIAGTDGHGLIGWDRGLGSVRAAAERAGQPAALVFRSLDSQNERDSVIQRYLDRGAFKAGQEGAVIMAGHARPETVTALFAWAGSDKASDVALAPVSAILRAP